MNFSQGVISIFMSEINFKQERENDKTDKLCRTITRERTAKVTLPWVWPLSGVLWSVRPISSLHL